MKNPMKVILLSISMILLTGCMMQPGTKLKVEAAKDLNPSINGEPSPIVLTVYQLKNSLAFERSDYKSLMMNSASVLGNDLIEKKSFEVRPAAHISISEKLLPNANYLGIVAAYRKPSFGGWHKVVKIDRKGLFAKTINVNLQSHEIIIKN